MLIIIVIVCVLGAAGFIYLADKSYDFDALFWFMGIFSGIAALLMGALLVLYSIGITEGRVIDDKIALYEEQNAQIEAQINSLVQNYMEYESNTFKSINSENLITLISLYPELKSDTLVSQQCDLYIENNKKILELKEEKISLSVKKFWVYFGK